MKLRPLIKRYGWFWGFAVYLHCSRAGHDWWAVGSGYEIGHWRGLCGMLVVQRQKMVCKCCQSAKLITVQFRYDPNGRLLAAESPDGRINFV